MAFKMPHSANITYIALSINTKQMYLHGLGGGGGSELFFLTKIFYNLNFFFFFFNYLFELNYFKLGPKKFKIMGQHTSHTGHKVVGRSRLCDRQL